MTDKSSPVLSPGCIIKHKGINSQTGRGYVGYIQGEISCSVFWDVGNSPNAIMATSSFISWHSLFLEYDTFFHTNLTLLNTKYNFLKSSYGIFQQNDDINYFHQPLYISDYSMLKTFFLQNTTSTRKKFNSPLRSEQYLPAYL